MPLWSPTIALVRVNNLLNDVTDRQLQHDLQQRQLDLAPDLELREVLGGHRVRGEAGHSGPLHHLVALLPDLQVLPPSVQGTHYKVRR